MMAVYLARSCPKCRDYFGVVTAEKVFGWKNVHKHDGTLVGKRQDKAGHWRRAKVPNYSTNPLHAYGIEERMKQLGRLDRYQKELSKITHAKNVPSEWAPRISVVELRSKLWGSMARSSGYANREVNHDYRSGAPYASVVYSHQLWNFGGVVFGLSAGTRLDVSVPRQMVSSFSGPV